MKRILGLLFLSFCAAAMADDPVLNLSARQRYPWNGKVDVSFTITGETEENYLSITATNAATGSTIPVRTIADMGGNAVTAWTAFAPGAVSLVWDAGADAPGLVADEVALSVVAVPPPPPLYLVVDLSAGADAASYPVSYLPDVPAGGWTDEYKTTKLVLRRIEAGTFIMGNAPTDESYRVTLTKPFYCGVFEVTQKQWSLVMGSNPSYYEGDKSPVEGVSYNAIRGSSSGAQWPESNAVDSSSFLGKLRARTGLDFDLPTEAQWEYACRAGTATTYSYGDSADGNYMWYVDNSSSTHEIGTKLPNAWGLYDMHGNVWEWCLDWYGTLAYSTNPKGSSSGSYRVFRGGSWGNGAVSCTSSDRSFDGPSFSNYYYGFRLVRTLSN